MNFFSFFLGRFLGRILVFFLFSWSLSWSSSCFLTFLFSLINSHLRFPPLYACLCLSTMRTNTLFCFASQSVSPFCYNTSFEENCQTISLESRMCVIVIVCLCMCVRVGVCVRERIVNISSAILPFIFCVSIYLFIFVSLSVYTTFLTANVKWPLNITLSLLSSVRYDNSSLSVCRSRSTLEVKFSYEPVCPSVVGRSDGWSICLS